MVEGLRKHERATHPSQKPMKPKPFKLSETTAGGGQDAPPLPPPNTVPTVGMVRQESQVYPGTKKTLTNPPKSVF